jgi:CRISPR-associated protein Cmr5
VSQHRNPHPNAAKGTPSAAPAQPANKAPEGAADRNIEQRRAAYALARIREIEALKSATGDKGKIAKMYRSYVSGFPAAILVNGLGQASATILAQSRGTDTAHKRIYEHLSGWLCGGDPQSPYERGDLIEQLVRHDQARYLRAQAEALALLEWLKRFAVAFLNDPNEPDPEEGR